MIRTLALGLACLFLGACDSGAHEAPVSSEDGAALASCAEDETCDPTETEHRSDTGTQQGNETSNEGVEPEAQSEDKSPLFELGTNITGANTPDSFSPLVDGDELNIELGFQGLWMVVLAFRTRNIFKGKLTIITRIEADGEHQGELGLAKQKLIPSGGSLDYYYNLFLVVLDPSVSGQTGMINIRISDDDGALIEETLEVQLTGGTQG